MTTGHDTSGARLLIVDDDPLLRGIAANTLRHSGFTVCEAEDGEQALVLFEDQPFDLLLLDVMMPGLDGYEVCSRIRRMRNGTRVPIVMLTGLNDTESIEHSYLAGATDFIAKPINWTLLSQRVRYSLRASAAVESAIRSAERLERAQRVANMGSWQILDEGERLVCSPELMSLFCVSGDDSGFDSHEAFLARVCSGDRDRVRAARQALKSRATPYQISYTIERFDGEMRTVFEQAAQVRDDGSRAIIAEGITQDITDRVDAERRIRQLAHFDTLTGLANRRHFDELAEPALARSVRLGTTGALLHLDIDRFKSVNDALGHATGDEVLRLITRRVQSALRSSDLAVVGGGSSDALIARVGANAFTILALDAGDDQEVEKIAQRLLQTVSATLSVAGRDLNLSASIGIALFPRDATDAEGLTRCAEQAAYAAKAAGRARCRFFAEEINVQASARLARESELRNAIGNGELRLHYQPKIDTRSGRCVGAEALVRWQHPGRGLVAPGEFIPLAEETGLILALSDWVLEQACADLRNRENAGLPAVPVAVNLASTSFSHEGLPAQLTALLLRHGLRAEYLTLEVTESLLMENMDAAVSRLTELRDLGFSVSLDDFGTGHSSLSYLKRFPIDELKIDRAFVTDVCRGPRDSALATAIIALGRTFGLRVVAEGVETAEQADFLSTHGCSVQQGFLHARPMPTEKFDALLAEQARDQRRATASSHS